MNTHSSDILKTKYSLFFLRASVFIVMLMWTLDKFVNPGHTAAVYRTFYFVDDLPSRLSYFLGGMQLLVILAFLIGFKKRLSYGALLLMHFVSTLSTYERLLHPYEGVNLLFYAAFPMLAAILALFILRKEDTLFTVG